MSEAICGNRCDQCTEKELLKCPGCRFGPGKQFSGECSIAKCCHSRSHHNCDACPNASTCYNLKSRTTMAANRRSKLAEEQTALRKRVHDSQLLGKVLSIMFWVQIVSIICGVFLTILESDYTFKMVGEFVNSAFTIAYAVMLIIIGSASGSFRVAGICGVIGCLLTLSSSLVTDESLSIIFSLVALVPGFIAQYQEFIGFTEVTEPYDAELAAKWQNIWFWALAGLCGMGIGLVLTLLGAMLGALLVLVASAITVVAEIRKLLALRTSGKLFKDYYEINQYFE